MKYYIVFLFITVSSISFGQIIDLEEIELLKTKIIESDTIQVDLFGNNTFGKVYKLKSKVNVQVSCSLTSSKWEDKENDYKLTIINDSNGKLLDSMYRRISKYWVEQEKWSDKYNANGDFSSLPVRDGFYKISEDLVIPIVKTEHEREETAFFIFWYNHKLFKIDLVKSNGFGGLSSFIEQNLHIKKGDRTYRLQGLVRQQKEIKKLLNKVIKPKFPKPVGYVNDFENILSSDERTKLEEKIKAYELWTTNEITIVTIHSIKPYDNIKEFATDLSNEWGIGKREKDNGLLILVSKTLRELRISTGLGAEKILTDEVCKEVIDLIIIPEFKKDDFYSGINKGITELIARWK